eukprot:6208565-Pleurochrysis_carterae.AAC.2
MFHSCLSFRKRAELQCTKGTVRGSRQKLMLSRLCGHLYRDCVSRQTCRYGASSATIQSDDLAFDDSKLIEEWAKSNGAR